MDQHSTQGKSQLGKTSFRKLFKQRSNKSLEDGRASLLKKTDRHLSVRKLQTKLDHIQQSPQQKVEQSVIQDALQKINFLHHNPEQCLCGSCECGRHLCKLSIVRPQMAKKTSYNSHYPMKEVIFVDRLVQPQTQPLKSEHLDMKTVYRNEFNSSKMQRIGMSRPLDNIKLGGSIQSFTTYQNNYKNFKLNNQYVKPTDRHTRDHFAFRSNSVYSRDFTNKNMERHHSLKSLDHLKLGKMWLGQSTYNQTFKKPKGGEYLQPLPPHIERMNKTLDDTLRFKTSYKSQFVQKISQFCPSKKEMLQKSGKLMGLKSKMNENADFKDMSPEFHAISTSKHFYV